MLRPTCGQTRVRPSVNCILAPTLHTHELPCSHPYSHTHQLLCDQSLRCTSCFTLTHSHLHNYRIAVSFGSRLLFSLVSQLLALSVGCDILEPSAILCVYILACLDAQQLQAGFGGGLGPPGGHIYMLTTGPFSCVVPLKLGRGRVGSIYLHSRRRTLGTCRGLSAPPLGGDSSSLK